MDSRNPSKAGTGPRVNNKIRAPEVRVIGTNGEMLGVMPVREALRLAREAELDLVEVNPKALPPVCKIMDFGKYKYEEKKRESEARKRQIQIEVKEIKLRPKTDNHDLEVKTRHVRRFIEEGNKVKVTCRFRGREIMHPETAEAQLNLFIERTKDIALVEQAPKMEAKSMTMLLAPRPEVRAKVAQELARRLEMEKQAKAARQGGGSAGAPSSNGANGKASSSTQEVQEALLPSRPADPTHFAQMGEAQETSQE
ncbi:MAG: translation initiation factor IF-3 [Sandaracinaceae bacterium]|nr:translation initiation factor IF-3 [Sandaracinaceae bacterium]